MLTIEKFLEKFDNETLTKEEIHNIPNDFINESQETKKLNWLPYENGINYLIFQAKNRFFIKVKTDNELFEVKYKI